VSVDAFFYWDFLLGHSDFGWAWTSTKENIGTQTKRQRYSPVFSSGTRTCNKKNANNDA